MQPIVITNGQARRFLVSYQRLTDTTAICREGDIVDHVRQVGCIQYDPLDAAGRNADLVVQSRFPEYRKSMLEKALYTERSLFDVWDKNMSIAAVSDWSYFSRFRQRHLPWIEKHKDAVVFITDHLQTHDYASSSDFDLEHKVDWHYGPQRLAKAALECMCYAGLAVVHHKRGARRYYGLASRNIPEEMVQTPDPNVTEDEYHAWGVLRRINSVGLLWDRPSDAWLGVRGLKSNERHMIVERLIRSGEVIPVHVDGIRYRLFISSGNVELLQKTIDMPIDNEEARLLAPLDNMLWDRKLIAALFDFSYTWEVYVPVEKRQYGYYVLPVMYNDRFIGRIEPFVDKKTRSLIIKNYWPQQGIAAGEFHQQIMKALERFAVFNECVDIKYQCSL